MIWDFVLKFRLPAGVKPEDTVDPLYEAGCDDALVGIGLPGYLGLSFGRDADSAVAAIASAITDVQRAVPGAELVEVGPDLVNMTEISHILGTSRQNVRKYFVGKIKSLKKAPPPPVHSVDPPLWRLSEIIPWARIATPLVVPDDVEPVALEAARRNLALQRQRLEAVEAAVG